MLRWSKKATADAVVVRQRLAELTPKPGGTPPRQAAPSPPAGGSALFIA